jgi:hypothetical protein
MMCKHHLFIAYMLVRKVWLKYSINIEAYFVDYLYILDLINARKMERTTKVNSKLE